MNCNQQNVNTCNPCNNNQKGNCTNSYAFVLVLFILIALVGSAWAR